MAVTTNGERATDAAPADPTAPAPGSSDGDRAGALAGLRTRAENVHLLRGFGPLVVGIVLFLLMVTLAPTVAPERMVERPVDPADVETTVTTATTTTTTAPAVTVPAGAGAP